MTLKQKSIVLPLVTVGITSFFGMIFAKIPLLVVVFPISIIIVVIINIIKKNPVSKWFLYGFIVAAVYISFMIILGVLSRSSEIVITILQFPFHG